MRSSNEVFKALREVALKESREREAVHVNEQGPVSNLMNWAAQTVFNLKDIAKYADALNKLLKWKAFTEGPKHLENQDWALLRKVVVEVLPNLNIVINHLGRTLPELEALAKSLPAHEERGISEASTDPADEAYDRVQGYQSLLKFIEKGLDAVRNEWEHAKKMTDGAKRYGGQHIMALDLLSGGPLRSLQDLRDDVNDAISTVERIVKEGSRGRGMIGARTEAVGGNGDEEEEALPDLIERLFGWNYVVEKLDETESDIKKAIKAAEGKDFQEALLQISLALEQLGNVAEVGSKLTGRRDAESVVKRASSEFVYLRRMLK